MQFFIQPYIFHNLYYMIEFHCRFLIITNFFIRFLFICYSQIFRPHDFKSNFETGLFKYIYKIYDHYPKSIFIFWAYFYYYYYFMIIIIVIIVIKNNSNNNNIHHIINNINNFNFNNNNINNSNNNINKIN